MQAISLIVSAGVVMVAIAGCIGEPEMGDPAANHSPDGNTPGTRDSPSVEGQGNATPQVRSASFDVDLVVGSDVLMALPGANCVFVEFPDSDHTIHAMNATLTWDAIVPFEPDLKLEFSAIGMEDVYATGASPLQVALPPTLLPLEPTQEWFPYMWQALAHPAPVEALQDVHMRIELEYVGEDGPEALLGDCSDSL